jgi:peptide methionine sulfoxide reductase MsrA
MVGYCGGSQPNPSYRHIQDYTEAIRVEFSTAHHSFASVIDLFLSAQGSNAFLRCSSSRQYRSVLWYSTEAQHAAIEKAIALHCQRHGKSRADFKVAVEPLGRFFYRAEEYHQHFNAKRSLSLKSRAIDDE